MKGGVLDVLAGRNPDPGPVCTRCEAQIDLGYMVISGQERSRALCPDHNTRWVRARMRAESGWYRISTRRIRVGTKRSA